MTRHITGTWLALSIVACSNDVAPRSSGNPSLAERALAPRWVEFGEEGARYRFDVPANFLPVAGHVGQSDGVASFAVDRDGGIGLMPFGGRDNPNTIVAFSTSKNLGVDGSQPITPRLLEAYGAVVKTRLPHAGDPRVVTLGSYQTIVVDIDEAAQATPTAATTGRHYLLLDGNASIAIECRWLPGDQAAVASACDAVAASMSTTQWRAALSRMLWPAATDC